MTTFPASRSAADLKAACFVLLCIMIAGGFVLSATGQLVPAEITDTRSYRQFSWTSLNQMLSGIRTPGYPAFLSAMTLFAGGDRAVPVAQYVCFCLGVIVFFWGLFRCFHDPLRCLLASAAILFSRILTGYVHETGTDSLAAAAGLAAVGTTLLRMASSSWRSGFCLSLIVTAAWLIRPAFLFLIVAIPAIKWLLLPVVFDCSMRTRGRRTGMTFLLVAAPLLAYCTLRLVVVGRFGIVSFGGFNVIGVAGQFLSEEDIPKLPEDLRRTASLALERLETGLVPASRFDELPVSNYMRMEERYDRTIWQMYFPDHETQRSPAGAVVANSRLRRLAHELILLHPREYGMWLLKATRQALRKTLWDLADSLLGAVLLLFGSVSMMVSGGSSRHLANYSLSFSPTTRAVSLAAISYWIFNLAVVLPVCPPLGRFTDSASVLMLSGCTLALLDAVSRVRRPCSARVIGRKAAQGYQ